MQELKPFFCHSIVGGTTNTTEQNHIKLEMNEMLALLGVTTVVGGLVAAGMPMAFGAEIMQTNALGMIYMGAMYITTTVSIINVAYLLKDYGYL